jgi:hypothetical protein
MYYKNKNNLFLVRKNKLSNKKIKAHKLKKNGVRYLHIFCFKKYINFLFMYLIRINNIFL